MDFLDVEGILVEFVLEDQLLQIVEGLLVKSLSDKYSMSVSMQKFKQIPEGNSRISEPYL